MNFQPSTINSETNFSIKDHPKAKGINLKLRVPVGWEIEEAQGPNIVKKVY